MKTYQETITISTTKKGTFEFTERLHQAVKSSGLNLGQLTIYCRHTSCSLLIMENADPSVRDDLDYYIEKLVPESDPNYTHIYEGKDDMPAHIKTALTRTSELIPFSDGKLMLGTWQGVFLWEHRARPHQRELVLSIVGE